MRRSLLIAVCLSIAACISSAVSRSIEYVISGFTELGRDAAATIARYIPLVRSSAVPALAYDGPSSIHELRHEASSSRLGAARGI